MNSESDDDVRKGNKVLRGLQICVFIYGVLNLLIRGAELLLAIIATSVIVAAYVTGIRNPNTFQDYLSQEAKHAVWRGPFNNPINIPHIPELNTNQIGMENVTTSIPVGAENVATLAPIKVGNVSVTLPPIGVDNTTISAPLPVGNANLSAPLEIGNVATSAPIELGNASISAPFEVGNANISAPRGVGNANISAPLGIGNATTSAPIELGNVTIPTPPKVSNGNISAPLEVGNAATAAPIGVKSVTISAPLALVADSVPTTPTPVGMIPLISPFDDKLNLHVWSTYFLMKCIVFMFGWLLTSSAKRFSFSGNLAWVVFSIPILAQYILQFILDLSLGDYFERELPSQIWQGVDVAFQLLGIVLVSTFIHQLYQMDDRIQGIERYNGFPSRNNGDISITEIVDDDQRFK